MKKTFIAAVATLASSTGAFAFATNPPADVPEISALEGTAAIAALAAVVLLAWERRRRAA